jgi:hypothetical protein
MKKTRPAFSGGAFGASILVLVCLVPSLLVGTVPDEGRSDAWPVTLLILVWAGLRLAWLLGKGERRLFEFTWWLFVYIFMGLAPTVQLRSGLLPGTTPGIGADLDLTTALIVGAGVIAFEVGGWWGRLRSTAAKTTTLQTVPVSMKKASFVAVLGIGLSVFLIAQTGLVNLFTSRQASGVARSTVFSSSSTLSIVNSIAIWGSLIAVHALTWGRRQMRHAGLRPTHIVLLVITLAVLLVFKNPISSARYTFGVIAMSLLVLMGAFATVRRTRISMAGVIVALFGIFPVADAFRRDEVTFARRSFFAEYGANADYDAFAQISNSVLYVQQEGLNIGHQLLGVVFFWVPRQVWASKPIDTGSFLAEFRGYRFQNLSAPLWAEFYINGGWFLVVVGMILVGYWLVRLDRRLEFAFQAGGLWCIAGAVLPFYMILVLRGSLLQATSDLVVMVLLLWLVNGKREKLKYPFRFGPTDSADGLLEPRR